MSSEVCYLSLIRSFLFRNKLLGAEAKHLQEQHVLKLSLSTCIPADFLCYESNIYAVGCIQTDILL